MKIVTWNVNSIKARTSHVQRFLERTGPDLLLLQELKGLEFPGGAFEGYEAIAVGQKAYNGVAILSKAGRDRPEPVLDRLPGDEEDAQARYLEVDYSGIRVINIYLPNGNPWPGPKFDYKLAWMDRLIKRARQLRKQEIPFLIGGDFNIIPEDRDCYNPASWVDDALFRIEARAKFRSLVNCGLTDALRIKKRKDHQFTFWDYFAGNFQRDRGIRIDHFLLSPPIADRFKSCTIDKIPRAEDHPSDHTPVILALR